MPCCCWFDPGEESKKLIKFHCQAIVDEIKRLNEIGDPIDISLEKAQELLHHLYYPHKCEENPDNR